MQSENVDRIYYCHGLASYFDGNKDMIGALSAATIVEGNMVDYTRAPDKILASFKKAMSLRRKYLSSELAWAASLQLGLAWQ